jgi:hypothetical protein
MARRNLPRPLNPSALGNTDAEPVGGSRPGNGQGRVAAQTAGRPGRGRHPHGFGRRTRRMPGADGDGVHPGGSARPRIGGPILGRATVVRPFPASSLLRLTTPFRASRSRQRATEPSAVPGVPQCFGGMWPGGSAAGLAWAPSRRYATTSARRRWSGSRRAAHRSRPPHHSRWSPPSVELVKNTCSRLRPSRPSTQVSTNWLLAPMVPATWLGCASSPAITSCSIPARRASHRQPVTVTCSRPPGARSPAPAGRTCSPPDRGRS